MRFRAFDRQGQALRGPGIFSAELGGAGCPDNVQRAMFSCVELPLGHCLRGEVGSRSDPGGLSANSALADFADAALEPSGRASLVPAP